MNASCMSLNSVSDIAERFYFSVRTENLRAWCVRGCMCVLLLGVYGYVGMFKCVY